VRAESCFLQPETGDNKVALAGSGELSSGSEWKESSQRNISGCQHMKHIICRRLSFVWRIFNRRQQWKEAKG
jgi:hypothetical protein